MFNLYGVLELFTDFVVYELTLSSMTLRGRGNYFLFDYLFIFTKSSNFPRSSLIGLFLFYRQADVSLQWVDMDRAFPVLKTTQYFIFFLNMYHMRHSAKTSLLV